MIKDPVCHKAPDMEQCMHQLPEFWHAIAMELFNPQHGWFAPSNFCGVRNNTVGENIIATIKMRNNFCYPLTIAILDFSLLLPI